MKLRAMLRDWRGFLARFRIRCPKCGRFYYVPSELASMGEQRCRCEESPPIFTGSDRVKTNDATLNWRVVQGKR